MKFKGKIKLGNISTPATETIPPIIIEGLELEYECEYALAELEGIFSLSKEVLKELPELLENAVDAFIKMEEKYGRVERSNYDINNDLLKDLKNQIKDLKNQNKDD